MEIMSIFYFHFLVHKYTIFCLPFSRIWHYKFEIFVILFIFILLLFLFHGEETYAIMASKWEGN